MNNKNQEAFIVIRINYELQVFLFKKKLNFFLKIICKKLPILRIK